MEVAGLNQLGLLSLSIMKPLDKLEAQIKDDLKVTVRCIPLDENALTAARGLASLEKGLQSLKHDLFTPGTCPFTGQPSQQRVIWAKSY